MKNANCNHRVSSVDNYCGTCGARVVEVRHPCGAAIIEHEQYCYKCGVEKGKEKDVPVGFFATWWRNRKR